MTKKFKGIQIANSFLSRGLGVIGWKDWDGRSGLLLKNSNAIHTFFVRFPLDVTFLDSEFKILKIVENLRPFSFSPIVWQAKHTLELPVGSVKKHSLKPGDKIDIV